jgi:hypothetical protein
VGAIFCLEKFIMSTEKIFSDHRDFVVPKDARSEQPHALAEILVRHADARIMPEEFDIKLQSQFRHGGDR